MDIQMFGVSGRNDGFGVAGKKILASARRAGHNIEPFNGQPSNAPIHFSFSQPHHFDLTGDFNVGYFPWESTLPDDYGWLSVLDYLDEIWVTSPWVRDVVNDWGFDAHVFEHGVDAIWRPKRRYPIDKVRFLFMGLEAWRKGATEALTAFNIAFQGIDDVELVLKTQESSMHFPSSKYTIINDDMDTADLVGLFHSCHAFVAPSYGEGFGLPALEAAATGMPVIATEGFFPYEDLLNPDLIIESHMVDSPWWEVHPGQMYQPSIDHLVDIYRHVYNNYQDVGSEALEMAPDIHTAYNWDRLTSEAFFALERRMG